MPSITDPLVLPVDLVFVPVAELPEDIRCHLEYDEGDVAVTRLRSRVPSKVINMNTASLLQQFRSEKTIVEAILRFSIESQADPQETLRSAFPFIQQFVNEQLLLPADAQTTTQIEASLTAGDQVNSFTIIRMIQVLQDTEVYQARSAEGSPVAIKLMRTITDPITAYVLDHEAAVLSHLDSQINPTLIESGEFDGRRYLVTAWCNGISADIAAQEIRHELHTANRINLLDLCIAILEAYIHLHEQQIVHADVHPRNILVDAKGKVKIIDFGLAHFTDHSQTNPQPHRGGVAFFFEPEYALARLNNQKAPSPHATGEQYALAALCYYLLTGAHYLAFSLEEERMLRQIVSESPLSFKEQGIESWPVVEEILARALSKDPEQRFTDVATFAAILKEVSQAAKVDNKYKPALQLQVLDRTSKTLLNEAVQRSNWDGSWFTNGLEKNPTASINYGSAGIAYWLYRMASVQGSPTFLALADIWASRAIRDIENEHSFYNPEIEITHETVGGISPYHTASGVYAVQALISQAMGDRITQDRSIRAFVKVADQPCHSLDLTLGWSGVLLIGTQLYEAIMDKQQSKDNGLFELGEQALNRIWSEIESYPPIPQAKNQLPALGIAHGWAGLLYSSLRWCQATHTSFPSKLKERLNQLAACAEPVGRGVRWPWYIGNRNPIYMPGWCNGTTGYLFLWSLAYDLLGDEAYMQLAEKAAWNIWEDPAQSANLCCGLAGRGYALLHWYKCTGDNLWLDRSHILTNRAATNIRAKPVDTDTGFEHSLYKGEVGIAALLSDLAYPKLAAFPFFESEGWHLE